MHTRMYGHTCRIGHAASKFHMSVYAQHNVVADCLVYQIIKKHHILARVREREKKSKSKR